jgi:adenylyltransferase/sulfurtransferase
VSLSDQDRRHYARQIALPEFGEAGQARLRASRVLIVGAGGLGSPAAIYLAAAGVGTLGLVEFDRVDESNLHRQILYGAPDVGSAKIEAAARRLAATNPHIAIRPHAEAFSAANALDLVRGYDVIVDGTDNFAARYLVNDACVLTGRPNVYGSVSRFEGQAAVFAAPGGPCYRCLHPEPPPAGLIQNCADAGVLGVLPGLIGMIQATEAIKLVVGLGEPLVGRLLLYDALKMRVRTITLPRDPACPVCGERPTLTTLTTYDEHCSPAVVTAARGTTHETRTEMTSDELRQWRKDRTPHFLLDVREPVEHDEAHIDGCTLIPLRQLQAEHHRLPKDLPIVVYCKSGGRSAIATAGLKAFGYDAHNLSGGIQAWLASGGD